MQRGEDQVYLPAPNIHENPRENFLIAREDVARVMDLGEIVGIHHSHPCASLRTGAGLCPSETDFDTQRAWQVPFWVTATSPRGGFMDFFGWGDELPSPPIRTREFRHSVTDCYALVRHLVHRVTGEVLIDASRPLAWWDDKNAVNPIEHGLARSGWVEVQGDPEPGDGVLFKIKGDHVNHCGLYLGGDLFAHHLYGRLSSVDPLPQWRRFLRKTVRFAPGAR